MHRGVALLAVLGVAGSVAAQEVTLPLERYEELRARARAAPEVPPVPPLPYALEAAQIDVSAGRQSARVVERLTLSLYSPGWQTIPLPALGSVTAAQLGSLEGRLRADEDIRLVVRGRGRHVVRIESVVPLREDAAAARLTRSLALVLPSAAAVTGSLTAGDDDVQEISITSGGLAQAAASPKRLDYVGQPGATLGVMLLGRARVPDRARLPLKFRAVSATLAEIARTRTKATGWLGLEVLGGRLDALEIELPKGFDVTAVRPAELGWEVREGRLRVTPMAPLEASFQLSVELTGEPQGVLVAPLLLPRRAAQLTLLSALAVTADGLAEVVDPGSGRRAEADELAGLPEGGQRTGAAYFVVRDPERAPRWSVTWSEGASVLAAQVDRLLVNVVAGAAGRAAYEFWAVVRTSGASEIAFGPPPGLELLAVERDGHSVGPGASERGLVVPLASGSAPQVVHVVGLLGLSVPREGELALALPTCSAPYARVEVVASLPGERAYVLAQEDKRGRTAGVPAGRSARVQTKASGLAALAARRATRAGDGGQAFAGVGDVELVQASWSALSSTPAPLVIRVRPRDRKEGWF